MDALAALGVGGQLMIAATLGLVAIYAVKGVRVGRTVGTVLSSTVTYVVAALVAVAVAIALGWVDPSPDTFMAHVQTAVDAVWDVTGGWVVDAVQGVVS
jgi:hypothetical protein